MNAKHERVVRFGEVGLIRFGGFAIERTERSELRPRLLAGCHKFQDISTLS